MCANVVNKYTVDADQRRLWQSKKWSHWQCWTTSLPTIGTVKCALSINRTTNCILLWISRKFEFCLHSNVMCSQSAIWGRNSRLSRICHDFCLSFRFLLFGPSAEHFFHVWFMVQWVSCSFCFFYSVYRMIHGWIITIPALCHTMARRHLPLQRHEVVHRCQRQLR